jgi:penicillin amidase
VSIPSSSWQSAPDKTLARALARLLLGERLPTYSGEIAVSGCHGRVAIRRDRHAIPYIEASSSDDAWFGLGFCHGQDRAGQLEVVVRGVRGTLAEAIGADGLAIDRLSRRIGFRRAGSQQLAAASPELKAQISAYTRGLNAALTRGADKRAHEHALLLREPTLWQPSDVQAYSTLLCFMLASNWDIELLRLKLVEFDGPETLAALDPEYPEGLPCIARDPRVAQWRGDPHRLERRANRRASRPRPDAGRALMARGDVLPAPLSVRI